MYSLVYSVAGRLMATVNSTPVESKQNAESGNLERPFIIGVSGGTFSGKTSVCQKIVELLKERYSSEFSWKIAIIHQDYFFKSLCVDKQRLAQQGKYNFDHPGAFDTEFMKTTLDNLILGKSVRIPNYNFQTHTRSTDNGILVELQQCDVVLFEGIFIFYFQEIRDLFNLKLFVDNDADTRLSRRVLFEVTERNKSLEYVLQQYTTYIKPAFEEFCLPSKKYADVIIPRGTDNTVAINLIVQHIRDFLKGELVRKSTSRACFRRPRIDSTPCDKLLPNSSSCLMNRPH